MGYISDLRKYVGHAPLIHAAASVIVEREDGRILLQKRTDNGMWGYAGGAVELFESVEDTARRELFEETGLTALSLELFGIFSGEEQHYIYPNGDEVCTIDIVYICREWSGELKPQASEVSELRFVDISDMPVLSPPIRYPMKKYTEYRNGERNAFT